LQLNHPSPVARLTGQNTQNSKRNTLSAYTKRTLGTGNLRSAVTLPENEDLNEWLAANIVDFFNEVSLLYGLCADDAQKFNKPGEGFPPGFEYRWADGVKITKPVGPSVGNGAMAA
jgi:MOB kinase activator 1